MERRPFLTVAAVCAAAFFLAACSGNSARHTPRPQASTHSPAKITIAADQHQAASELMLHSMSLIGTPYRFGGSSRTEGFDCSGMVQYVYKTALDVNLPRTARDIAAAGRSIGKTQLRIGDLVFFNTGGHPFSHVGLYIGGGEFIHAPSSRGVIRTNRLDEKYYAQRFTGARTFFR